MDLLLDRMQPEQAFKQLVATGVSEVHAARIIGDWIVSTALHTARRFAYQPAPLAATAPDCASAFVQSFKHQDWVDGVSVVQAGQTPGEQGFNDRLHRVENDLGNLHKDIDTAFTCVGELRKSLSSLLTQVATELNALNSDVAELYNRTDRLDRGTGGIVTIPPRFMGTTKLFNKDVSVWQTQQGIITLPAVETLGIKAEMTPPITGSGSVGKLVAIDAEVQEVLKNPTTVGEVKTKLGDKELENGQQLSEALVGLPDATPIANADALLNAVADQNAAIIKSTGATDAAIAGSFTNLGTNVENVAAAPVERLETVPPDARAALSTAGVDTVGKLADTSPTDLANKLAAAGVKTTPTEVAGWAGTAKTLTRLRG
jgi:hypothetical protein